jgi:hypothetical protein
MEFRLLLTATAGRIPPQKQITAIRNHRYIILNANTRGKEVRVILDSGAQGNFISPETVKQLNIFIREKKNFIYLVLLIGR